MESNIVDIEKFSSSPRCLLPVPCWIPSIDTESFELETPSLLSLIKAGGGVGSGDRTAAESALQLTSSFDMDVVLTHTVGGLIGGAAQSDVATTLSGGPDPYTFTKHSLRVGAMPTGSAYKHDHRITTDTPQPQL